MTIWSHHIPIVIVLCLWFLYLENLELRAKTLSQSTLLFHGQYCWTQRVFTDTITTLEQTDNMRRKALLFIYTTYEQRAWLTVVSDQEGNLGHQHVLMDALFTQNISFPSFLESRVASHRRKGVITLATRMFKSICTQCLDKSLRHFIYTIHYDTIDRLYFFRCVNDNFWGSTEHQ